jgi:hypothetical protein
MKYKIVNVQGFSEIRQLLSEHSIKPASYYTDNMINAWASTVENSMQENDRAEFEIPAWYSSSGHTTLCRLSDSSIDEIALFE